MIPYKPLAPFAAWGGSREPKLVLVGEAWGRVESELRKPFVGESGKELFQILGQAFPDADPALHASIMAKFRYGHAWTRDRDRWLEAAGIGLTNVLAFQPTANSLDSVSVLKVDLPSGYAHPPISRGKYLDSQFEPELERLTVELEATRPNLIVAMGNTAIWALLNRTDIGSIRGTVSDSKFGKVLPTYHPAAILRQWSWRPILVADLMKAQIESEFPEVRRPQRTVVINPTLHQLEVWVQQTLANPPPVLGCDIETWRGQITCISFARSRSDAIVVPFVNKYFRPGQPPRTWLTFEAEYRAWELVAELLESEIPKVGQNFIYDLQYITRMAIRPRALVHDTMLLHHALYPEMQKGLGFLGSIYTAEPAWKLMRKGPKADEMLKADE